ncbi:FAD-dependent oxidoreductase [Methanobacterium oryzae]|uniref:FAD-dependent oxidoreductase n=1 Tax=Methanobacterium oryzae TaxID=69540 RepID=UPI003D1B0BCB
MKEIKNMGKLESFWIENTEKTNYPVLEEGLSVDVAILGAGIAGITSALFLKEAGLSVALIEAGKVIKDVTANTTAKVTAAHNVIYSNLESHFGKDGSRIYAEANQAAIDKIESLIKERNIDCDFKRLQCYVYSENANDIDKLKKEAKSAADAGLEASYTESSPLPFDIAGAVRYENQAEFHPRKYLLNLIKSIPGEGSYIFENTRAHEVKEGDINEISTDKGPIKAKNVIIATHFPIYDPSHLFAKMYPSMSYALGLYINEPFPEGMYISTEPTFTYRSTPSDKGELIIASGANHKVGHEPDTIAFYKKLENHARDHFNVKSIDYHWSTQDNITMDKVPYIGKAESKSKGVYVATGFMKWGMTNGTVAAMILSDLILGKNNPWSSFFDPSRSKPVLESTKEFIGTNVSVAKELLSGRISRPKSMKPSELQNGEGKILNVDGKKVAAYKDKDGKVYAVSSVCVHLGCQVNWNNAEKTWDCPCHGSRYRHDGKVIHPPALRNLKEYNDLEK